MFISFRKMNKMYELLLLSVMLIELDNVHNDRRMSLLMDKRKHILM